MGSKFYKLGFCDFGIICQIVIFLCAFSSCFALDNQAQKPVEPVKRTAKDRVLDVFKDRFSSISGDSRGVKDGFACRNVTDIGYDIIDVPSDAQSSGTINTDTNTDGAANKEQETETAKNVSSAQPVVEQVSVSGIKAPNIISQNANVTNVIASEPVSNVAAINTLNSAVPSLLDSVPTAEQQIEMTRDKNAPISFQCLTKAVLDKNHPLAEQCADEFVNYMVTLMFNVRQITHFINGALLRRGLIDEEAAQYVDDWVAKGMAEAGDSSGSIIKATHDEVLRRVDSDPKQEVEIYYFFTLSCSYCRYMSGDIERMWLVAKNDPKIKMIGLTVDPTPKDWLESYRKYTGITMPILDGSGYAKSFNVGFVPAVVVVAPNLKKAYRRSGEQQFERLYEFVRKVQGLPATMTPAIKKLISIPIGYEEKYASAGDKPGVGKDVDVLQNKRGTGSLKEKVKNIVRPDT